MAARWCQRAGRTPSCGCRHSPGRGITDLCDVTKGRKSHNMGPFLRCLSLYSAELKINPVYVSCPASSLAVVECVGALAELHPAAFIAKLIPKLKKEMFTGEWKPTISSSSFMHSLAPPYKSFNPSRSEPMDQDNSKEDSEQHSHHAVRQRCLSALAAASTQPSVVQESTPVLLEVLSSAHTGSVCGLNTWSNFTNSQSQFLSWFVKQSWPQWNLF